MVGDARVNTVREALRTAGNPEAIGEALLKALREIEPQLPVARAVTVTELASGTLRQERLIARLTTVTKAMKTPRKCHNRVTPAAVNSL